MINMFFLVNLIVNLVLRNQEIKNIYIVNKRRKKRSNNGDLFISFQGFIEKCFWV